MLKSVAGRPVPFNPLRLPSLPIRSRRVGLRTIPSIGGKAPVCPFEFYDGWETADFSKWSTSVESPYDIITSPTHHGDYAAKGKISAGALKNTMVGTPSDYYIRLYFRLTGTTPTGGSSAPFIKTMTVGNVDILDVYMITGGAGGGPGVGGPRFELMDLIDGAWADGTTTLVADKWYCVEILCQGDNASAVQKLWLDGTLEVSINPDVSGRVNNYFLMYSVTWGAPYTGRNIIDCLISDPTRPTCVYYPACGV